MPAVVFIPAGGYCCAGLFIGAPQGGQVIGSTSYTLAISLAYPYPAGTKTPYPAGIYDLRALSALV